MHRHWTELHEKRSQKNLLHYNNEQFHYSAVVAARMLEERFQFVRLSITLQIDTLGLITVPRNEMSWWEGKVNDKEI